MEEDKGGENRECLGGTSPTTFLRARRAETFNANVLHVLVDAVVRPHASNRG